MHLPWLALSFLALERVSADGAWQVYYPKNPDVLASPPTGVYTAGATTYTGSAAYQTNELTLPALPNPLPALAFNLQLYSGGMTNLSVPQNAFMGFSIEMSVSTQVLGKNSSAIHVPFLNLMSNIVARMGWVRIRVGGNSQEDAKLVSSLDGLGYSAGTILAKDKVNTNNPTGTPPLDYTTDLFHLLNAVSEFTNVRWYLGIPFYDINPVNMDIVVAADSVLGDRVLAYQVANEPDYYAFNGRNHRQTGYSPADFAGEFGQFVQQVAQNGTVSDRRSTKSWMIPSISATVWNINDFVATNAVSTYNNNLYAMTVERYPNDNCAAVYGTGTPEDPQQRLTDYTNHLGVMGIVNEYAQASAYAVQQNLPFIMFETNTASCSGFPGISDAFVGALWSIDWALSLAANNFSAALFHVGGQRAFYNAFTPPPTNQSAFRQWTVGPAYYATLVLAEVVGKSNASQVVDLFASANSQYTPAWAVYESGRLTKAVVVNYLSDSSGAADVSVTIALGGGQTGQPAANPSSVRVKYLRAPSIVAKAGFTWAGQTFGNHFEADGLLRGDLDVQTVQCDLNIGCVIKVPAPSAALIFYDDASYADVTPSVVETFPTTYHTATLNTVQIDAAMLAGNGHVGLAKGLGATSPGSRDGAESWRRVSPAAMAIGGALAGAAALWHVW